jgi:hypothetical protein
MNWLRRLFAPAVRPRPATPHRVRPTLEALEDRQVPAVLTVTSLADYGAGTLRTAVAQANSDSSFAAQQDTIQFAPYLSGTITLSAPVGLGAVGLEIDGSPAITLSGGGTSEVFQVSYGASVSLNGLAITNGSSYDGGAIYNAGSLTLNGDTLSGNVATLGGGIDNQGALAVNASTLWGNAAYSGFGGGIYNQGTLTLDASTLWGNAAGVGGGIYNQSNAFVLVQDNCNLSGNAANQFGGGIDNHGLLSISGGTLSANTAANGGAIENGGAGSMYVEGATLSYNAASFYGGAVNTDPNSSGWIDGSVLVGNSATYGGGIVNSGTLTVSASTLSGNSATYGGGIFNLGTLTLDASTLWGNSATYGGGVYNYTTGNAFVQDNCNLSGNAASYGGGIDNFGGTLTLDASTLSGNSATYGGGIYNQGTVFVQDNCTLYGNTAALGSGLYNDAYNGGTVSLDGSTFIGNNFNPDGSFGGDLYGV